MYELGRAEARAEGTQSKEARAWCHIPVTAAASVSCAHDTNLRHGKRFPFGVGGRVFEQFFLLFLILMINLI